MVCCIRSDFGAFFISYVVVGRKKFIRLLHWGGYGLVAASGSKCVALGLDSLGNIATQVT